MNELWEVLLKSGLSEEETDTLLFTLAQSGSPYFEVTENEIQAETAISINPYPRMIGLLEPLLTQREFCDTPKGQKLFHLAVKQIYQMDCYRGYCADTFRKEQMQTEIEQGCFGKEIASLFAEFSKEEKNKTLSNVIRLYRSREQIYCFVQQIQILFPGCLVFRKRTEQRELYIYMGRTKNRESERKTEFARKIFLPRGYRMYIAWDKPYLLTDINRMEVMGNHMK